MRSIKTKTIITAVLALILNCLLSPAQAQVQTFRKPVDTPIPIGVADSGKTKYKKLLRSKAKPTVLVRVNRADLLAKLQSLDPAKNDSIDFYLIGIDESNVDLFLEFNPGAKKSDLIRKQTIILGYEAVGPATPVQSSGQPFSMSLLNWSFKYFATYYSGLGRVCPPPICN